MGRGGVFRERGTMLAGWCCKLFVQHVLLCGVVYVPSAGRRRISSKWEAFASSIAWDCRTTCPIMALREYYLRSIASPC